MAVQIAATLVDRGVGAKGAAGIKFHVTQFVYVTCEVRVGRLDSCVGCGLNLAAVAGGAGNDVGICAAQMLDVRSGCRRGSCSHAMTGATGSGSRRAPRRVCVGGGSCLAVRMAIVAGAGTIAITRLRCATVDATELGYKADINLVIYVQGGQLTTPQVALGATGTSKTGTPVTTATHIYGTSSSKIKKKMFRVTAGCD
ncbi:MAG: hypothetical protein ACD_85C00014G0001 [uncultured bacterium]|nr:MAG: hypothetical protein ACD_85C00014G0001 [uncultured bacterium]